MSKLNELIKQRDALDAQINAVVKAETTGQIASQENNDKNGHFANYTEYSKNLRSWLVAYGIGGPVLFLTNKDAPTKLVNSHDLKMIIALFVLGVTLQIFLAFINKWIAWHLYKGSVDEIYEKSCIYQFWLRINDQSWIDIIVDLFSLLFFTIATWMVLNILLAN